MFGRTRGLIIAGAALGLLMLGAAVVLFVRGTGGDDKAGELTAAQAEIQRLQAELRQTRGELDQLRRGPDALLALANEKLNQKDPAGARQLLEDLQRKHPASRQVERA